MLRFVCEVSALVTFENISDLCLDEIVLCSIYLYIREKGTVSFRQRILKMCNTAEKGFTIRIRFAEYTIARCSLNVDLLLPSHSVIALTT